MAKEVELEEEENPDVTDSAQAEIENLDFDDGDDFEPVRLSFRQWLYVSLVVLLSFISFTIFMFPLEDVIRYVVSSRVQGLEFQKLELNYFGRDQLEGLLYNQAGMSLEARQVKSGLAWWSLGRQFLDGPLEISSISVDHPLLSLSIRKMNLELDVGPLGAGPNQSLNGQASMKLTGLVLNKFTPLAIEEKLIQVSDARLKLLFNNGAIQIQQLDVNSNAFRIRLNNGSIGSSTSLATAPLKGQLCLSPTDKLRTDDRFLGLRTLYELSGGSVQERFCSDLTGTLGKPGIKPKKPLFMESDPKADSEKNTQSDQKPNTNPKEAP